MGERERQLVEDLINKARAGDREAFACLVERFHADLARFARHLVGDPHDAQDVTQDAWLEAWRCLGNYRDGAEFRLWLFGIAKNVSKRLRRGARALTPLDETIELVTPVDIREEAQAKLEEEQLRHDLSRLRPEERALIELRFFENMTYKEIAKVIGRKPGAAHSRMHRVMRKLRRWAEKEA